MHLPARAASSKELVLNEAFGKKKCLGTETIFARVLKPWQSNEPRQEATLPLATRRKKGVITA